MFDKLDNEMLDFDIISLETQGLVTPRLMRFATTYIDLLDKFKLNKGLYFAQVNVLSTPDDDYFEYDLLRIDKDNPDFHP